MSQITDADTTRLATASTLTTADLALLFDTSERMVRQRVRDETVPQPAQRQPAMVWDASTFWPWITHNHMRTDLGFIPVQHWTPFPLHPTRRVVDGGAHLSYLHPDGGPLTVVYPDIAHMRRCPPTLNTDTTVCVITPSPELSGFTVYVYPAGQTHLDRRAYTITTADLARVIGTPNLPYWPTGLTYVADNDSGAPMSPRTLHNTEMLRALTTALDGPLPDTVWEALEALHYRIEHDAYSACADDIDRSSTFPHLELAATPAPLRPNPTSEDVDWATVLRTPIPGNARRILHLTRVMHEYVTAYPLVLSPHAQEPRSIIDRLVPADLTLAHAYVNDDAELNSISATQFRIDPLMRGVAAAPAHSGGSAVIPATMDTIIETLRSATPDGDLSDLTILLSDATAPLIQDGQENWHPMPALRWSAYLAGYTGTGSAALAAMLAEFAHRALGNPTRIDVENSPAYRTGSPLEWTKYPRRFTVADAAEMFRYDPAEL